MQSFGGHLRDARQAAGMSQAQLGGDTLSRSYISLLEGGQREPTDSVLVHLAERLGRPLLEVREWAMADRHRELDSHLCSGEVAEIIPDIEAPDQGEVGGRLDGTTYGLAHPPVRADDRHPYRSHDHTLRSGCVRARALSAGPCPPRCDSGRSVRYMCCELSYIRCSLRRDRRLRRSQRKEGLDV